MYQALVSTVAAWAPLVATTARPTLASAVTTIVASALRQAYRLVGGGVILMPLTALSLFVGWYGLDEDATHRRGPPRDTSGRPSTEVLERSGLS
ncbi:hypothetical protein GCM10009679_65740 [Saccharothrix algeriensis]